MLNAGQARKGSTFYPRLHCPFTYRMYSINRPGRLLKFWTLRVGAYSRLGAH